jgi:hypothetical protein
MGDRRGEFDTRYAIVEEGPKYTLTAILKPLNPGQPVVERALERLHGVAQAVKEDDPHGVD